MRTTSVIQKILPSAINTVVILLISSPFWFLHISLFEKKMIIIALFFLYGLVFICLNEGRDLGMILIRSYWKENYSLIRLLIYNIFYTMSFASLFFWIYFPFDIFLVNMLFLQLPTILVTETTLHGFLSGKMTTVFKQNIIDVGA